MKVATRIIPMERAPKSNTSVIRSGLRMLRKASIAFEKRNFSEEVMMDAKIVNGNVTATLMEARYISFVVMPISSGDNLEPKMRGTFADSIKPKMREISPMME